MSSCHGREKKLRGRAERGELQRMRGTEAERREKREQGESKFESKKGERSGNKRD